MPGVAVVTSDAHAELVSAKAASLPGASWQTCLNGSAPGSSGTGSANREYAWPKGHWDWPVRSYLHGLSPPGR